jgi:HK97 family phage portal protein
MAWRLNPNFVARVQQLLFGTELVVQEKQYTTTYWDNDSTWFPIIREPFTGAWQRNMERRADSILSFHAVYSCIERIASDVGKCRLRLVEQDANGIWNEIDASAFSPVIRKPNRYQNRIQFFENWMISKLTRGNTYVLKEYDQRNIVIALYVLDPSAVQVLVAPDGEIVYELSRDNLTGIGDRIAVPAEDIIHDMMTLKHHPLCGIPPIAPASLAAHHGLTIQRTSTLFFDNSARPSGVLSTAQTLSDQKLARIKEHWNEFKKGKIGQVAVLGDGLKFEKMSMDFVDAQLLEQLGISAKMVCSSFGVPPHMVQVGDPPSYNNIGSLNQLYYQQTLQKHFEAIELLLDEALGLTKIAGKTYGTWFDLDDLLRMDPAALIDAEAKGVGAGITAPNEARLRINLAPTPGGAAPYLQQQNYSLAALAKRDAQEDPFAPAAKPAGNDKEETEPDDEELDEAAIAAGALALKQMLTA